MHSLLGFKPMELLNYGKMSPNLGQIYPDHGNFQTFYGHCRNRVGSGNFQVFSGFLWPKLRIPHCMFLLEPT